MGSLCSGGEGEQGKKFQAGGENDLSNGPKQDRGCTDIVCIPLFIAAQFVFIVVTIMGMADGNPHKLYQPRDYQGAYCGVETNWNGGPNTADMPKLSYTMNVTSVADVIMKQLVCSSYARTALTQGSGVFSPLLTTQEEKDKYLCDCCLVPCGKCEAGLDNGGDLTSGDLASVITSRMSELTDPSKAADLFSPGGANGGTFSTQAFWEQATKYLNPVCLPTCAQTLDSAAAREYVFAPTADNDLYSVWNTMLNADSNAMTNTFKSTMQNAFTFKALPLSVCPYSDPAVCVPMPGVDMEDLSANSNYCTFGMAGDVANALSSAAASTLSGMGIASFGNATEASFGKWAGDFQESMDTIILVSFLAFVIGLVFLVLLRFFIGVCVWIAVLLTVVMFFFGGCFAFVLSGQCAGASLLDTGHQNAVSVVVAGHAAVSDAISGTEAASEACTGDCADYRGRQQISKYGKKCLDWETQDVMPQYRAADYTALSPADETKNYCRNPWNAGDANVAKTIWCVTSDPDVMWEECIPIGVIQPVCANGYEISTQQMRDALFYSSFVIWGLGVVWIVVILCMVKRIRLAIALNKVAAMYLATNPLTLLIPVIQATVAIVWCLIWFFGASYLLSQVPDSYTPKGYYATYAEAYGTGGGCAFWEFGDHCAGTPGACTDQWPVGSVWKDNTCEVVDGVAKCWRCAPPRYALDIRFAASFFVFLWNNAFNVALGQMLIAMAVSLWFFTTDKLKAFVVAKATKTVFRYHIGTVAFGSFIVAVVQFIRYLMKYFEKQAAAQKNRVMVLILKCVQCCIWCFEKCVKFLNKNAYIQTALMGTSFCTSAKKAFFLILRNALRFGTMAVLGCVVEWIGFFCIMTGTGVVGYFLMGAMNPEISPFMPMLCFLMISYVVASLYMNVFGLAVDTCLQCFLAVEEMGTGGEFVPDVLSGFVKDSGKQLEDPDAKEPEAQGSE